MRQTPEHMRPSPSTARLSLQNTAPPMSAALFPDSVVTTVKAAASTAVEAKTPDSPEDTLMQAIHWLEAAGSSVSTKLDKSTHKIQILDERTSTIQEQSQAR